MTPELWIVVINFAIKFGIDAAIAIATAIGKPSATIDDAIAALTLASEKTAQQYLDEAKAARGGSVLK
jgi:hypothetical protein